MSDKETNNHSEKELNITTNYLKVAKTARYASFGNLSAKTKYFWLVLHGSNMLCEQVIYKFKDFDPTTHFVVAPEALSRFYAKGGYGGDVLAAWMTKRDRLHEIKDIANYLTKLFTLFDQELPANCKKQILGFSQGGTMVFRWFHARRIKFDHFIAYSCWIPEDIDLSQSKSKLEKGKVIFTYGKEDAFLTKEKMQEVKDIISKNNLMPEIIPYTGTHRIDRMHLTQLFDQKIK